MPYLNNTFDTQEPSLKDILSNIESGETQLPDFQRGWVWDDNHIRALISSVSLAYPIGAIMILETGGNGVKFKPKPVKGVKDAENVLPEELILDGQQRLTSLYLSLKSEDPVPTTTEKKQEIERFYYLDMKKCLDAEVDRYDAIISIPKNKKIASDFGRKVELDLTTQELEFENEMFPLNIMFDLARYYEWTINYRTHHNHAPEKSEFLANFERNTFLIFQQYKVPVIKLTKETPKEAVCQVFENVNTGGVSLTVFELMTATFAADDFLLRKDWETRKEILNQHEVLKGVDESSFLTAITLLASYKRHVASGSAVGCKRKDVLRLTLEEYEENVGEIVEGYINAAKLLMGGKVFSQRDLPYQTQLIPLSVICAYLQDGFEEYSVKQKIIRWYWCGVLGELYGGANETRYALDISGVISWINGGNEPPTVRDAVFSPGRLLTLQTRNSAAYKGIMALLMKTGSNDFISGDEIELTNYFGDAIDIHHIFPRKYCENNNYEREKWNSIINKAPLSYRTNRILGGHEPSKYIATIENKHRVRPEDLDKFFKRHLIEPPLIRDNDFQLFILDRSKKLLEIIENAMGKTVAGKDSDEVINSFGGFLS